MNISITNIHCSTADISVDDKKYKVCYWDRCGPPAGGIFMPPVVVWIQDVESGIFYDMNGRHDPVKRLVPLFQAICDANREKFLFHDENL